jgi:thiol-disulfide isomerase/thioredoxin
MKTKIQIILALLLASCNVNNTGFTVTGLTSNIPDSTKIYLTDSPVSKIHDSTFIINNHFQFKGSIDSLTEMTIHTKDYRQYKILWVDKANITLDATKSDLRNGHVSGSHFQDVNSRYLDLDMLWKNRIDSISSIIRMSDKKDSVLIKKLSLMKASAIKDKHDLVLEFMKSNPDFSLGTFYITFLMFDQPKQFTQELFNALSDGAKNNKWGKSIRVYLEKSMDLSLGDNAVDFTLPDIRGDQIALSSFRGKYLLLEFWSSSCGPCRMENPILLSAYRKYRPKGFEILGVNLDERKDLWESTIKSDTLIWSTVSDLRGLMGEVPLTYKANYMPKNFLVDQQGKIIGLDIRGFSLNEKLDSIFKN